MHVCFRILPYFQLFAWPTGLKMSVRKAPHKQEGFRFFLYSYKTLQNLFEQTDQVTQNQAESFT